jgi:hypothetical protein
MTIFKSIFAALAVFFVTALSAQTTTDIFAGMKPSGADLKLEVNGHGSGSAYLNVRNFDPKMISGTFNSSAFADKAVRFTASVEGSKISIKTDNGYKVEADLKKQDDGSFMGQFTGDFSGTVKLTLKQ